ncbi:alpha/beta hydrolase [Nocardioides zeae]|uniref:Alpha-beta hydrolase superfamily lysophospholipase n=1 Tax=Nocardioides zeae TaxID=1457234 RepID=A0AAJ1TZS8_9ACTN|nr:alpha/beta hydrolase [Nocardioides zeae]MDQ1104945.1 alpha-beta hydrolase superfamily lysophospholipase [Nocardioides zeae]
MTLTASPRTLLSPTTYDEPAGVAARATLVVLTGRGETPAGYARLGRRLSADAYRVRVVATDLDDLDAVEAAVVDALGGAAPDDVVRPRVLLGSDAGANVAARLAGRRSDLVDALVLAGVVLPGPGTAPADGPAPSWDDELETRSACPAYRRVIGEDTDFVRGALEADLPAEVAGDDLFTGDLPTLVLHGESDPLTPVDDVLSLVADGSRARAAVVAGGRHDVLNDVDHRSVAATVVLFLESLRRGADLPTIVAPADR